MLCEKKPTAAPTRRRYMYGDQVKFHGRKATVVEVVPPGGRPTSKVAVATLRTEESYVISAPIPPGDKRRAYGERRKGPAPKEYLTWPMPSQLSPVV